MTEQVPSEEKAIVSVSGRVVELDGGRKVALGTDDAKQHDGLFMTFFSPEAGETRLRLSYEAMDALVRLYTLQLRDLTKEEETWSVASQKEGEIICERT